MSHKLPEGCPRHTPWGATQHGEAISKQIYTVSTSSHGGIHVAEVENMLIPEPFRRDDGWYEEDCDWAVVAHVFPHLFREQDVIAAKRTLRSWRWRSWEECYEEEVPIAESPQKAEHLFRLEHASDLLTVAAFGDWHRSVPPGMVGVVASPGGCRTPGRVERCFLVTAEAYGKRHENPSGSLVVDPGATAPWVGPHEVIGEEAP